MLNLNQKKMSRPKTQNKMITGDMEVQKTVCITESAKNRHERNDIVSLLRRLEKINTLVYFVMILPTTDNNNLWLMLGNHLRYNEKFKDEILNTIVRSIKE